MNTLYDDKFKKIDFYGKYHPEYMPFVGDKYEDFRILQVGESHYIPQLSGEEDIFPVTYFEKWFSDPCSDMSTFSNGYSGSAWGGWFNTRDVVLYYLAGNRKKSHSIFTELVKAFALVCQNRTIQEITTEESQNYHHFAFMNFFQMPSLYEGMKFWNSLLISAGKSGLPKKQAYEYACNIWDKVAEESSDILDSVIDILKPEVIVFTSKSAWGAYTGRYKNAPNIITTVHPGCKYWNKPTANQVGKEKLVELWKDIYK